MASDPYSAEWYAERAREYQIMYEREVPLGDAAWTLANKRMGRRYWVDVEVVGDWL